MFDTSSLLIFIGASLALLVTPGPAVLYIVTRSIDQGRLAGFVSVLGIQAGALVHIMAAAVGLSAILASSALAFSIVKWIGAAYLVYLGLRKLLESTPTTTVDAAPKQSYRRIFQQGFWVNLLNPKTALFFFAFLPQFVDPTRGTAGLQIAILGAIFIGLAICSDGMYALLAGTLGTWLKRNRAWLWAQKYIAGSVYVSLGALTA